jgi:hypothetical protein
VYIGQDLQVAFSSYLNIDDISGSFNSVTTSFALTVNGSTPVPLPINSQQCLISVGGIIQRPDDTGTEGFRLSGSNIVFSSAPNTGEDFFGTILAGADYINAGVNFPDGQSSAPSITFDQDLDTGFFRSSSGAVSFSSNGVNTATLGSNSFTAPSFIPTSSSVPSNGVFLPAANSVAIATNGTQQATVDSSGRLLIGTSSSSEVNTAVFQGNSAAGSAAIVTISNSLNNPTSTQTLAVLSFTDNSHVRAAQIACLRDGGTWTSGTSQPSALTFSTTANGASALTEAMRIDQAQRVAIGSAGGGRKFNVQSQNAAAFFSAPSNGSCPDMITIQCGTNAGDTTTRYINFRRQNGAIIGYVGMNGASAVNYSTSSDYRLKENVTPVSDGITRLQQLKPSRFNFIADPAKTVDGFLAHEVQTIVPEAITGEKDAVDDEGNPEYQGIDQSKLVPLLTAALQEAVAKIESLEARLTAAGL